MSLNHQATSAAHPDEREGRKKRLRSALMVTASFLVVEMIGAFVSGSLALLADATHMFADVAALILAYAAMSLASRAPTTKYTFGLYRAEILAAFVNAQILLLVSAYIFYEAYHRLYEPREIATGIMLGVAIAGLVANAMAVRFLHGDHHASVNIRAAYVEVLADMIASVGVIVTSIAIRWTGWFWLDSLVSAGIGALVVVRTISLLKESGHILLEGTPPGMDIAALTREIEAVAGVTELHDLHVWTLTSGMNAASLHIRVEDHGRGSTTLTAVQRLLRECAGVEHATIQVEWGATGRCETAELRY